MRKGFLHVVEALIVIMLVFVVLSQFYSIPRTQHTWSTTKLRIMGQDLLYTLDEKGVDWFDAGAVDAALSPVLPNTTGYSLVTWQDIRPELNVGCVSVFQDNCTDLNSLLNDRYVNGIYRNFTVEWITPTDMEFDLGGQHLDNDVILFWGCPSFTAQQVQNLKEYLRQGNGIVEYANLTSDQAKRSWQQELFNINWSASTRPPDTEAEFIPMLPTEKAYGAVKIYDFFNDPDSGFTNFGYETVYPNDEIEGKILVRQWKTLYSSGDHEGRSIPLVIVDWGVGGKGRTAWMSNATLTDTRNADLLKSVIIWAAGEKEYVVKDDTMSESAKSAMRKIYNSDMFEPVKIELTLGYHF
jgi:hypothetical protein